MANRIGKLDYARIRQMTQQAQTTLDRYRKVVGQERFQQQKVHDCAQAVFDDRMRQALEAMEVEQLNKGRQGLRVSLLREAGIENVWQVSQMSYRQICDIDGLGEQSAGKIRSIIDQITENTRSTLRVRLSPDHYAQVDTELIRSLYNVVNAGAVRRRCQTQLLENSNPIRQELQLLDRAKNGFRWFFTPQDKRQQTVAAMESLSRRLAGEFGNGQLLGAYDAVLRADDLTCWADYRKQSARYYAVLEELGASWFKFDEAANGLPAQLAREVEQHPLDLQHLKATLRGYQTFGTKYILHQKRTLLGDEMGLGKTVQAIAAMAALKAEGKSHFMVVCPASVLVNWCREIPQHSSLTATKVHGGDEEALLHWRENGDVCVTTYESISRFALPEKFRFAMLVVDEAHYVKNPEAQRTKALQKLLKKSEDVLFMSGTPLENRVEEMCFLVSCLQEQVAKEVDGIKYISTAQQFREKLAPVYLRRTRDDVLQELPDLIEKEQWCELSAGEAAAYRDAVLSGNFMAMRQVSWNVAELSHSSKAARLLELCDMAKEQGRKVIVFSFFRDTISKVCGLLGQRCMEPITGSVSPQRRQEIVDEFGAADDGAVLVSQVQAGGTGVNIQCASVVIFCEPQIKPSIENQAISRAYRMGQVRDVLVYRLLSDDCIDERILEILRLKQEQFDNFADESAVGEEAMKASEQSWINRMIAEERERLAIQEAPMEQKLEISQS